MTGSLSRLVLRAQGRLPTAEPLLPSRYAVSAPSVPVEVSAEAESTGTPHVRSERADRFALAIEPPAARPEMPVGPWRQRLTERAEGPPRGQESDIASRAPVADGEAAQPEARAHVALETPHRKPTGILGATSPSPATESLRSFAVSPARAPSLEAQPLTPTTARHPEVRPRPRGHARDTLSAFVPLSVDGSPIASLRADRIRPPSATRPSPLPPISAVHLGTPAAPEVRISIGCVEIHAAPPRPASTRQAPARRPTVSLADYLAKHEGRTS